MKNKILAYLAVLTAIMLISVPIALALDSTDAVATSRGTPAPEVIAPMQEPITDYKSILERGDRGAIKLCDSEGRTWDLDIDGFWLYGQRGPPYGDSIGAVLWPVIILYDDCDALGRTSNMWACIWTGEGFDCYWRNTAGTTGTGSMWFCEPTGTEYYAVIAGDGYTCSWADNDAIDLYNALLTYSNWDASNMKLLVSDAIGAGTKHDCTKANIQTEIAWMASQADADDVCVFFYAGHGGDKPDVAPLDESDGYDEFICPEYEDILDDELNTWMSAISGYKLVALDSCFSGGFIRAVDGMESRCSGRQPRAEITDGFAQDFCRGAPEDLCKAGFNVHTACDENEFAYGIGALNNGVFTYYLVDGLNGLTADSNSDGDVDALEAHQYLLPNVILYMDGLQNPQLCDLGTTDPLVWVL
jgi:hypothetical protein